MLLLLVLLIVFSGVSFALVKDSINGLELNDLLLRDLDIVVYGDYGDIPMNNFEIVNDGYYVFGGKLGEYRYHGFDALFNPYSNEKFPDDATSYSKLSMKNWLEEGWRLKNYKDDIYYSYIKSHANLSTDFLKEAYLKMLPFQISENDDVYKYLYVSQFPTIMQSGQGIMWHETENGIWYQSFSLKKLEDKLPVDVRIELLDLDENDFDFSDERKSIDLKVNGELLDQSFIHDEIQRSIKYNREDIQKFVFNINGEIIETYPNGDFNQASVKRTIDLSAIDMERGYLDINLSVQVVYLNDAVSQTSNMTERYFFEGSDNYILSYFNTGNIIIEDSLKLCDISYFDLSRGMIDTYEITFENRGIEKTFILSAGDINERVKDYLLDFLLVNEVPINSEIRIRQEIFGEFGTSLYSQKIKILKMDEGIEMKISIPDKVFDVANINAVNRTDMTGVMQKSIYVDHQKISFDYFFSGNYHYGMTDRDKLVPIDVTMTSFEGIDYEYHTWLLVESSKPNINFVQSEMARENRELIFINKEETVNSIDKLANFPVTYEIQIEDEDEDEEVKWIQDGFIISFSNSGVYEMLVTADNGMQQSNEKYRIVVLEDLKPFIYLNLYDNQIYRGENLQIDYDYLSVDGDEIIEESLFVYEDLDSNGIYEKNYPYSEDKTFSQLGNYKLTARVKEKLNETVVERNFMVDNKMPITNLSLMKKSDIEKVDLLILMNEKNEKIINNINEYELLLSEKGYDAKVDYFFDGEDYYETSVVETVDYGNVEPAEAIFYDENGFTGTLDLIETQDLGEFVDLGAYKTKKTCTSVPVYGQIRSCDRCGTYINPLGFRMCKFCYVVVDTVTECTTKKYWVSDIQWVPDYVGIYSGTVSKTIINIYEDTFREDSRKVIFYLDPTDDQLIEWQYKSELLISVNENDIPLEIDQVFKTSENYPYSYLINEPFDLLYGNFDFEEDPIVKEEFVFFHNPYAVDNSEIYENNNNIWLLNEPVSFNNPGLYEVKRRIFDSVNPKIFSKQSNEATQFIKIHRLPIVNFDINQGDQLELVDFSYDPDYEFSRDDKGIVANAIIIEDESGNKIYDLPESLLPGEYIITYSAKDIDGAWGSFTKSVEIKADVANLTAAVNPKVVSITDEVKLHNIKLYGNSIYGVKIDIYKNDEFVENIVNKLYSITSSGRTIEDIVYEVPENFLDGQYYFVITFRDYRNSSKGMTYYYGFSVYSPIHLRLLEIENAVEGEYTYIYATTEDYVNNVYIFDGQRLRRMYLKDGIWTVQSRAKEGMYIRATLNNQVEQLPINFDYPETFDSVLKITGDWNYWRGQYNILDEKISYNPLRFMAYENIHITLEGIEDFEGQVLIDLDNRLDLTDEYPKQLSKTDGVYTDSFRLPLAQSSLSYSGKRMTDAYSISVTYDVQTIKKYFEITGNIYDRVYVQPGF